jgi:hypothetical protein
MQVPGANSLQDLRMGPGRPSGLNPLVCDALGKMEHALAVGEHRGASLLEIEPAAIDLAEMRQQVCPASTAFPASTSCRTRTSRSLLESPVSSSFDMTSTSQETGVRSTTRITRE